MSNKTSWQESSIDWQILTKKYDQTKAELHAITAQRDALLEALKHAQNIIKAMSAADYEPPSYAMDVITNAIALCERGDK